MAKKETAPAVVDTKEVEKFRGEIEGVRAYAGSLEVKTEDDYKAAMEEGMRIKKQVDAMTTRKEEITKPLYASYKSVMDLFKPFETAGKDALATIKDKMLGWKREEDRKADEKRAKLAAREERGTMTSETAARKIAEVKAPEKTVRTDAGMAVTKKVTKYRVVDASKIPLQFMEPNMVAIKKSFEMGQPVAGVEAYEDEQMDFRS